MNSEKFNHEMRLVGEIFGVWRVICRLKRTRDLRSIWMVACTHCNHTDEVDTQELFSAAKPCGHCARYSGRAA